MAKQWYEYDFEKCFDGEWNIPVDIPLMREIETNISVFGRHAHLMDCFMVPGGRKVLGFVNAKHWSEGTLRVLYVYETAEGGSSPSVAILTWSDQGGFIPPICIKKMEKLT